VNPTAYAFAVVEQRGGKDNLSLRTFVAGEIKNLNVARPVKSLRLQRFASILSTSDSFLWILKMCSLSTILREYSGMHSVASHPFKDLILSASENNRDGDDQKRAWNVPQPLMDYLKTNLNGSQLDAVNAGLSRRSFVLIQVSLLLFPAVLTCSVLSFTLSRKMSSESNFGCMHFLDNV
uniref:Uncharacterized protein n=1 Tax=Aegilops tauschii subsp. strangulata TaxID=200361 RepID=A0A453N735_AEGTS